MRLSIYRRYTFVIYFLFASVGMQPALGCTTFMIPNTTDKVMGKSFDWHHSHGLLVVNKRKVEKQGVPMKPTDKPPTPWTSAYGSITLNQIGREFPLSGLNEKGLAIEIMVGGNKDPEQGDKPTLNELQWIQYQLDNYATVDEVMKHAPEIHVSRVREMVHYLICDKSGACGVVEFVDGALVRRYGSEMVVNTLANSTYDESIANLKKYKGFGGDLPMPESQDSLDRFTRATLLAAKYDDTSGEDAVGHAFDVLKTVFTPERSVWNIVYELSIGRINYRTIKNPRVRSVGLRYFDFSCKTPVKVIDVHEGRGDITDKFVDYTFEKNQALINASLKDFEAELPPKTLEKLAHYPETTVCKEK